uniref:RIMS-binding protein 2 n=1 Tax=Sparus aurata TaxID=8175 RepID=A0A671TPZ9_SPAAU
MREVAERRQQLELEHEQALAILKFKQDEIKRLQRAQLFAKREHEGVVQMLESKVRDLEEKCRSQSEQFGLLSQELDKFRLQASKVDLAGSSLLNNPSLSVLTNGVGLTTERDVAAALRMGATPHAAGLSRVDRSPVTKHRELPTISVSKSGSSSSKSETAHLTPKSDTHLSPHKSSPTHEVDTASEVEELDIDVAPAPYTASRGAAKLQVFIARYSYNPYDGPNDNPEVELPLTAGEYIYVYGDMDDDGFYEGELMDGRRGLVPSNFVERVSDDDVMSANHPVTGDISHNSLLDSSLHSASHQHHLHMGVSASERTEASVASGPASAPSDPASALAVPAPLTNGLDLDLEEVGVDIVPYPRKLTLIKQLAKSIIIGWDPPLVPAGWGNVWSYNVYVDQELRLNVPFGSQTKAVLERLDINLKAYRVSVQSLTEKGLSDQLRCSLLVGRDVCVAPTQVRVERITATSANLTWLPSNSNYVHIVSLNEEECELVKAGCYSLCLNNLLPSLQYTVKVEARPHRTPWELPVERREHRSATITFTTLMAGPPDAPLDVQLEHGPTPGIALISWLPVTIDAAGTSNGVRVTGYTIYADKRKVLEVSSPTAGSALLGPSQIQSLQAAQELTVRTMSAHGESCDSFPVNVPSKLPAIMAGPAFTSPVVPALTCPPAGPTNLPSPLSYGNSAAKVSMLPSSMPSDTHIIGLTVEVDANTPHALHSEEFLSSASYVKAWANPSSAAALAVCEATLPVVSTITPVSYNRGSVEPPSDYHADNSRSDLSDILEEEEEDYSDHLREAQPRGYTVGANRSHKLEPPDSDEEVLERILKLPPQLSHTKQLFIIPEVTEEEDSSQEEHLAHRSQPRPRPSHHRSRDSERLHHAPHYHPHQPNPYPHIPPHHHHYNRDPRSITKEPLLRHGPLPVKPKTQHRVHYADTVDTISYPEEDDMNIYEGPTSRRVSARCPPQPTPNSKERVPSLLKGLGDRLRREAMLRSQMAATAAANPGYGHTPPRPYPVSKTVRTLRSPISRGVEIDVEYGTDDNEEPVEYGPGEVVVEQMSSEWWVEGTQMELSRPPHRRGLKADPLEPSQIPPAEAGPSWAAQAEVSSKPGGSQARQLKGVVDSPKMKGDGDIRIFVALFPYDPAIMSPNPDAAEEELPFTEGQIIKVYGDKDPDGFYRGESGGRLGFVPCNMVSEIQVEDEETRQQLLQQGFLSTAASMEKIDPSQAAAATAATTTTAAPVANPAPGARRMVAIFDYDPRESSPNTDIEAELTFSAGDIIHVFGDMDEDGFFYGDLNGHRGLVPSNFLQALPEDAPAEHVSAQPAPEPKKELQETLTSSTESQGHMPSRLEEPSPPKTEPPIPDPQEHTDPKPKLTSLAASPMSDPDPASPPAPGPATVEACSSAPAPLPTDSPTKTDCAAQGKKKKGFFSKGKKLFRKLGSSKKD